MFETYNLEIHAWHGCNLACESCAHYSSLGFRGGPTAEMCENWMELWAARLRPRIFSILGGEPTLNRDLERIIRSAARIFPDSAIRIVSNGFLLGKHPGLVSLLSELRGRAHLEISVHHGSEEFQSRFRPVMELVKQWQASGTDIRMRLASTAWTRRYKMNGNQIDFPDGDPVSAWSSCYGKGCKQLYMGHLWKCAPIAYFGLWPSNVSVEPVWQNLADSYTPLLADCSDDELGSFLGCREEAVCRLCPSQLEKFELPIPFRSPGVASENDQSRRRR
nr:radical SAM protein [uncultured Rhodopila sp.]